MKHINGQEVILTDKQRKRATISPSLKDIYWAAGFIEGEGCFQSFKGQRCHKPSPRVHVAQVNLEPILKLKQMFGGNYNLTKRIDKNCKDYYEWIICGSRALGVMFTIYLLMSQKRQTQIRKAVISCL